MKIIRPQREDVDQIKKLFAVTVSNNFREEGILETMGDDAILEIKALENTLEKDFERNGQKEYFLIAKDQDKVLGTIANGRASKIITENLAIDFAKIPEIKSVYILPAYQNKGIGSVLLKRILIRLSEQGNKAFCLDSGYKKAQIFWKRKLGDPVCTLPDYWAAGSHHMIWHNKVDSLISI